MNTTLFNGISGILETLLAYKIDVRDLDQQVYRLREGLFEKGENYETVCKAVDPILRAIDECYTYGKINGVISEPATGFNQGKFQALMVTNVKVGRLPYVYNYLIKN